MRLMSIVGLPKSTNSFSQILVQLIKLIEIVKNSSVQMFKIRVKMGILRVKCVIYPI